MILRLLLLPVRTETPEVGATNPIKETVSNRVSRVYLLPPLFFLSSINVHLTVQDPM